MTQKNISDQLRNRFTADLAEFLAAKYDVDVCKTAAGTLMIPTVDDAGEDRWVKFSVIIPKEASEDEVEVYPQKNFSGSSWTRRQSARPRPQKRQPKLRKRPQRIPKVKIPSHLKFEKS